MIIIQKNDGVYVDYEISGTKITFDDELMLNLSKYERDNEVTIDICRDNKTGSLVSGVPESGKYVAQIMIPAREYVETPLEIGETESEDETQGGVNRDVVPLQMEICTLSLWAI